MSVHTRRHQQPALLPLSSLQPRPRHCGKRGCAGARGGGLPRLQHDGAACRCWTIDVGAGCPCKQTNFFSFATPRFTARTCPCRSMSCLRSRRLRWGAAAETACIDRHVEAAANRQLWIAWADRPGCKSCRLQPATACQLVTHVPPLCSPTQRKLLPLPIACRPWLARLVVRTAYIAVVTFCAVGESGA